MKFLADKKIWIAVGGVVVIFILARIPGWLRWLAYAVCVAGAWTAFRFKKISALIAGIISAVVAVAFFSEVLPGETRVTINGKPKESNKPFNDGYPETGWY